MYGQISQSLYPDFFIQRMDIAAHASQGGHESTLNLEMIRPLRVNEGPQRMTLVKSH